MQLFGIAGWKRSGKTELMTRLIPLLAARGLSVSAVKEARHDFDIDKPGKDSFLHRMAGASEVMLSSTSRWALMQERRGRGDAPSLDEIVARLTPVDLVLVEGFRAGTHPKIEAHRASSGNRLLAPGDPTIVAVASDTPLAGLRVPVLAVDDLAAIAGFIAERCGLAAGGAAPVAPRHGRGNPD